MRITLAEHVTHLNSVLGPTLVATLAGVRDRSLPSRWAQGTGPVPSDETLKRLTVAGQVWKIVEDSDGADIARAWFIGANPALGGHPPVFTIRDGRFADTRAAARTFARDDHT